jgi:tyrosinase
MLKLIPETFAEEDQNDMIHAAQTWRLPFWDWAMKKPDWHQPTNLRRYGPNVPYLLTVPKVQVKTKTGFAEVDNPMWKFTLPPNDNKKIFGDYGITDNEGGHPVRNAIVSVSSH